MKITPIALILGTTLTACPATAYIIVDGTRDYSYGPALAVQTVRTRFGDEDGTDNGGDGAGSELDAAYAKTWNGRFYLLLTGNIQPNFNKLEIFIDSVAGGENTLSGVPQYDFFDSSQNMAGLTFDTGFAADYHLFARGGDPGGGRKFEVDFIRRAGGNNPSVAGNGLAVPLNGVQSTASGSIAPINLPSFGNISGPALTQSLEFAFNNSNTGGIGGDSSDPPGAADPIAAQEVTSGFELSISLADLGHPSVGSTILISVMQDNSDHNYLSNQFLGGLPAGQGNLGGNGSGGFTGNLGGVNLNNYAGNQYFSVLVIAEVPEPTSTDLCGLAVGSLAVWFWHRRRFVAISPFLIISS